MNMITKRCACACAGIIFMLLAAPRYAEAVRLEYSASQDGFQFKYRIPFFGFGRVALTDPDDPPENIRFRFLFIKLATIKLSIASINPDAVPPSLTLQYDITNRFAASPITGTIAVPFGDAGLRIKLFRKWFLCAKDSDAEIDLLLTRRKSKYALALDLPLLKGNWEGKANRKDNQIQQTITYDNMTFADINLTFSYLPALFTKLNYVITVTPDPLVHPDNSTIYDGDLVLPNGSYHAWFNAVQ